ncbi:hypothetical protein [Arenibacter lacus]|nr:hypothetical protein [Arenibacter lacus]
MGIYDLLIKSTEIKLSLDDIHFSQENKKSLNQLLNEFKHFEALKEYDLPIDN